MSESIEIVELTDSSINEISPEVKDSTALQNTTKSKRQLEDELDEGNLPKKTKLEESIETKQLVSFF